MKLIFKIITFSLFLCINATAQEVAEAKPKYIVVVSYPEHMYNTSGEYFICQASELTPGELNDMFRRSMLRTMMANVTDYYKAQSLSSWESSQKSHFQTFNKLIKYQQVTTRLKGYYKGYPPTKLHHLFRPAKKKWGTDCVNNFESKPNKKTHTYTKVNVVNDSLFSLFADTLNAAYFLVLNKFEMKTRFKNCSDMSRNVFQRDFFLHYSLITDKGKVIDGGVVGTTYQSSKNDAEQIMLENLGFLSGMVVDLVRKKI